MSLACPNCKDDKTEPLPDAFNTTLANLPVQRPGSVIDLLRGGVLSFRGQTDAETTFLRKVAPPRKISYYPILACWFITTLAATIVPTVVGTLVGYAVLFAAGFVLYRAYLFNKAKWPLLFQRWKGSYVCMGCGNIFSGEEADTPPDGRA